MTIARMIPPPEDTIALYERVGWTAYTNNATKLIQGLEMSLAVFSAWEDGKLIGLIRAVGDGETILYIQDLLVDPMEQDSGIGTALLEVLQEAYPDVRQKVILCDDSPGLRHFCRVNGFMAAHQVSCCCYLKLDE